MLDKFKNYNTFLNESIEIFGKMNFREVASLLRKNFPSLEISFKTINRVYYDPVVDEMKIFNINHEWLQLPARSIKINESKKSIEVAKFLQSLKVAAWTNYSDDFFYRADVYIISDDSLKHVKKLEREALKKSEIEKQAKAAAEITRAEEEDSRERYKKLYEMLRKVPYSSVFQIPGVGTLQLIQLNRHQVTWGTRGHFKIHDSNSKKDMDELEKIVKYIYTESHLKTKLTAQKYNL